MTTVRVHGLIKRAPGLALSRIRVAHMRSWVATYVLAWVLTHDDADYHRVAMTP